MSDMKGQELRRTKAQTRTQRHREESRDALLRLAWYVAGIALGVALMTHYSLWNPGAVLAVLGGIEVVARAWKAIWDWMGA